MNPDFLEKVYRYLKKALSGRWGADERYEDALQEGVIRAWKDIQEGSTDNLKILHRAKVWSLAYLSDPHKLHTGQPRRSRSGIVTGAAHKTYEEVRKFSDTFFAEHGRKPTSPEVAESLGISTSSAASFIKKLKSGYSSNHTVTNTYEEHNDGNRRLKRELFQNWDINVLFEKQTGEDSNKELSQYIPTVEFEDDVISRVAFTEMIKDLPLRDRTVLYYHYVEDLDDLKLSEIIGSKTPRKQAGYKARRRALELLREKYQGQP